MSARQSSPCSVSEIAYTLGVAVSSCCLHVWPYPLSDGGLGLPCNLLCDFHLGPSSNACGGVHQDVLLLFSADDGRTKPIPRKSSVEGLEPAENKCLLRATDGKRKISTVVSWSLFFYALFFFKSVWR